MRLPPGTHMLLCALVLLAVLSPRLPAALASPSARTQPPSEPLAARALLVENVGQLDQRARFLLLAGGASLWLAEDALWLTLLTASTAAHDAYRAAPPDGGLHLRLSFPGANSAPAIEPYDRLGTRVSSFRGSDPASWYADIPTWAGVRYVDLYPGIDLKVSVADGSWTWRLVARTAEGEALMATTAGDSPVRLLIEGARSAAIGGGAALLSTTEGDLALPLLAGGLEGTSAPEVEVLAGGAMQVSHPFAGSASGAPGAILAAGSADLLYSTFLGGVGVDTGRAVAVDASGHAYVTGETWSTDFPTTPGAFDTTPSTPEVDSDAFVIKLAPDGRSLMYATFIGGAGHDNSYAIAVDAAGNAYIAGETQSADFATTPGAFDRTYSTVGWSDAFVAKLNATGTALSYATYLGGSDTDIAYGIAADAAGNAYVTGYTGYTDPSMENYERFPTTAGAYDESHNGTVGDTDAFVVKLNADGSALEYGTLYGGSDRDEAYAVAIDGAGCAYVTGMTQSADLPVTPGAFATTHGGDDDAFVLKLSADGSRLEYAALLGSSESDWGHGIAVDNVGSAYVTGFTSSQTFPVTTGAFDTTHNGEYDAFVTKVSADGASLVYSTFLGGSRADKGRGIAVDRYWCAYVAGETYSSDMPVVPGAFDALANGQKDAFVAKLNTTGSGLAYGTYLGGLDEDVAHGIAVGEPGIATITGETGSYDYPTTSGAFDRGYNFGGRDAVVSRLTMAGGAQPTATPTLTPSPTLTAGASPTPSATPEGGNSGSPTATSTPAPPSPTPTAGAGGYPGPSPTPTATATPMPLPTPDPRLWARCFLPMTIRP